MGGPRSCIGLRAHAARGALRTTVAATDVGDGATHAPDTHGRAQQPARRRQHATRRDVVGPARRAGRAGRTDRRATCGDRGAGVGARAHQRPDPRLQRRPQPGRTTPPRPTGSRTLTSRAAAPPRAADRRAQRLPRRPVVAEQGATAWARPVQPLPGAGRSCRCGYRGQPFSCLVPETSLATWKASPGPASCVGCSMRCCRWAPSWTWPGAAADRRGRHRPGRCPLRRTRGPRRAARGARRVPDRRPGRRTAIRDRRAAEGSRPPRRADLGSPSAAAPRSGRHPDSAGFPRTTLRCRRSSACR